MPCAYQGSWHKLGDCVMAHSSPDLMPVSSLELFDSQVLGVCVCVCVCVCAHAGTCVCACVYVFS